MICEIDQPWFKMAVFLCHGITLLFTHLYLLSKLHVALLVALLLLSLYRLFWGYKIPLTHQISFRFFLNGFFSWLILLCLPCSALTTELNELLCGHWLFCTCYMLSASPSFRSTVSPTQTCPVSFAVHYFVYLSLWGFAKFWSKLDKNCAKCTFIR